MTELDGDFDCPVCNQIIGDEPHALGKSFHDPFDYVLKLRTGEVVRYGAALHPLDGFVRLEGVQKIHGFPEPYTFARGLDVRLTDIVWVADAGGYDS